MNSEKLPLLVDRRKNNDDGVDAVACAAIVGLAVFSACLFGIYTRPFGFLASVWPANAILLGLFIRLPKAATALGWGAATLGFFTADVLTGASLFKTALLTAGNLAGIGAALLLYSRLPADIRSMRRPTSPLFLILASMIGGAASGLIGAIVNPILFDGTALSGLAFWFATETANYLAILPVILTAPSPMSMGRLISKRLGSFQLVDLSPALALLVSGFAGLWIGGPGAIAFPVPALLWCGLSYSLFTTALTTLAFCFWALLALTGGYLPLTGGVSDEYALVSTRIGVSLIALAPLMVASVIAVRDELLHAIRHQAAHDYLTGIPNRRAFREAAEIVMRAQGTKSIALLMIDIDHFKSVNDRYGHEAGDEILRQFAAKLKASLRSTDLVARLGGEEFVVVFQNCDRDGALAASEHLRTALTEHPMTIKDGATLYVTASIGISVSENSPPDLDSMIREADEALYKAKSLGRNRVVVHQTSAATKASRKTQRRSPLSAAAV